MVSESRLQTAEMISQGKSTKEILEAIPQFNNVQSVHSALKSKEVKEQIKWHRDNLFEKSRIDRVQLLRDFYESVTCPTGPIFQTLQGDGELLLASNLKLLDDVQSRLIQQVEAEPLKVNGETVSVIKKIRFHSPDAARKILSKAAGFEDGALAFDVEEQGGPFRGLVIVPPKHAELPPHG